MTHFNLGSEHSAAPVSYPKGLRRHRSSAPEPSGWIPISSGLRFVETSQSLADTTNAANSEMHSIDWGGRSPEGELATLLNRADFSDLDLPTQAEGVYANLSVGEYKLRLYALVWAIDSAMETELSLCLILGPVAGSYLPMGTQLTVKEKHLLLTGQALKWTSHPTYLYTQVFGSWAEQLTVEVLLPNNRPVALPPLAFLPPELAL